MPRLIVRVVGTEQATGTESILAVVESDQYDPDRLDALVSACLASSLETLKSTRLDSLRAWCPEVSVVLNASGDETVRPSMHLTQDTLSRLAEAGASFDFDPYV
jgi:hypothetical protein